MNLNDVLLLIHVLGAIGFTAGTLIALFGLLSLRHTERVEQARSILGIMEAPAPLSGISLLLVIATGLYMTFAVWGWQTAWIDVALGSLMFLVIPTGAVMGTRRRAISGLIKDIPDGSLPGALVQRIHDPVLGSSTVLLNGLLLGILVLMIAKPILVISLIVMGASIGLGLVLSIPIWLEERGENKTLESAGRIIGGNSKRRI